MEKKSSEKEYLTNNNQSNSLILQIYKIIRLNWIPFAFALLITLITIIVVPIVYKLDRPTKKVNDTNLSWNITGQTILNQSIFLNNSFNYLFGEISSLRFDLTNNLFILDKTNNRIIKYNIDNHHLELIAGHENGSNNSDSTSFNSPNDLFIDSTNNNIYVADTNNHRIQLWITGYKEGSTICGTGISGSEPNQLNQPMSLTMDDKSLIYIADYGNNRIVTCNSTTKQFQILISYKIDGERNTYLFTPISIKYHSSTNSLVIAQKLGYNVVRWKLDSNSYWTLIAGSASSELSGTSRTLFKELCYTDCDEYGNTYVVDCINQRIQFYNGDLTKGRTIAGVIQAKGNNTYIFHNPSAIALDKQKNLYVADSKNYRIQKFNQTNLNILEKNKNS